MISQDRYVKIVSGVGAGAVSAQRKLILRLITQNALVPPGIILEFTDEEPVGAYFGTQSEEYKRAKAYFGFISKNTTSPSALSFARWVDVAIAPMVVGDAFEKNIASFSTVIAGTLELMVGATNLLTGPLDFTAAASLTDVATIIQAGLRALSDPQLVTCTVTYNTNTNQFVITGAVVGSGTIEVVHGADLGDISQITGLATGGTVLVEGQAADTPEDSLAKSSGISNNFGSFVFAVPYDAMTIDDVVAVASWNHAQNNMYMYSVPVLPTDAAIWFLALKGFSGTALSVLSATAANDYIEQSPCEILAATNYEDTGAAQNYMFYQFPARNITVSDDPTADVFDKIRCNYIGVTQSAGQKVAFYQRGLLCGGTEAAVDMNVYANEQWLKSANSASIMTLLLAMPTVPADEDGAAMILGVLQPNLTMASANGTFAEGKPISVVQQQYITVVTGDKNAWRQVQSVGYWINVKFSSYTNSNTGLTEWKATYKLIYSKGDAIRYVEGTDSMI